MCVREIKHHAFGTVSYFLLPIEESGTEDGTETILPPSSFITLRPFLFSISPCLLPAFCLLIFLPVSPQPE